MAKREPVFRVCLGTLVWLLATCQSPLEHQGAGEDQVGVTISFVSLVQPGKRVPKKDRLPWIGP